MRRIGILLTLLILTPIMLALLFWLGSVGRNDGAPPQPTAEREAAGGQPTTPIGESLPATARPEPVTPTAMPTITVDGVVEVTPLLSTPTLIAPPTPPITVQARTPRASPLPTVAGGVGERPTLTPLSPEPPITNGDRADPVIALTFDACQDPDLPAGYDDEIIRILIETDTPATLFLGGDWMRTHPDETRYLAAQPQFELGNHGWAHIDFATATVEEMIPEIERTQDIMWELAGRQPVVFRFPGGAYTEEALGVVAGSGVRPIEWEVVSGDPDPDITAERMIPWVVNQVQNGSIIIMHMNGRGWHTAEALPTIIEQLREQGFRFVTVSQLLGAPPAPASPAADG